MEKLDYNRLLQLVLDYSKNGVSWHHHFLTKKCVFNKEGAFQIILENENTGDFFVYPFDKKPMKELE